MQCPACQHENRPQAKFCEECGTPLTATPSGPPARSYAEIASALSEAFEQQTATADILRVISTSPANIQPVFDAMVQNAMRLCDARDAAIFRVDDDVLRLVANQGPLPAPPGHIVPVVRGTVAGRSMLERRAIQVADLQAEVEEYPEGSSFARQFGHRSILNVPLLREAVAIGAIQVRRGEVRPFTDKHIELLQTFANQAVI